MLNGIKKVCLYLRVSTEEQTEGYSLTAQLNTLRQYAELQGWHVSNVYADEGISGKSVNGRPQLQQLIHDLQNKQFDGVLVWKISRLSRSLFDTLNLLRKFEEYSVKFISYSENFDTTTAMGRLVLQIMASIAEMERNTLSDNVKLGMRQKAMEGGWNGGIVLGYDSDENHLIINKNEAEIVRMIFTEYAQGKGLKAVANLINKSGFTTKKGRLFSINGVAQILDNPMYIGKIRWMRLQNWETNRRKGKNPNPIIVNGLHQPIISEELWTIVQERRANRSFKQRQSNEPFILNALLRCPECEQGMVPHVVTATNKNGQKRKYRYYECGNFANKGSTACHSNSILSDKAEEHVYSLINQLVQDKALFKKKILGINGNTKDKESTFQHEIAETEKRLSELNNLQIRYFRAFEEKLFPIEMLQDRLSQVANEKVAVEHRILELKSKLNHANQKPVSPEAIEDLLQRFVSVYETASRERKKHLIQLLVKKINLVSLPDKKRIIDSVELEFDFEDLHKSKSIVLIHHLFGDSNWRDLSTVSQGEKHLPPYLQNFLPLFMVRFTPINPKRTIHLLQ
jgi:site-specific DNA recombinase